MKEAPVIVDFNEEDDSQNIKDLLFKYLKYWPWFLVAVILSIGLGYVYLRYAPKYYTSVAKIRIIDDSKDLNVASEAVSLLTGSPKINLDNEIEIIKSYRLLSQVVEELNLDISYYQVGNIKTTEIWDPPFLVSKNIMEDSLVSPISFDVSFTTNDMTVTTEDGRTYTESLNSSDPPNQGLPISVLPLDDMSYGGYEELNYKVVLKPKRDAIIGLQQALQVQATNKNSEILSLSLKGESKERSEATLNMVINKFDQDGIIDRQLISQRTLEVIDKRFVFLTEELDSIEIGKKEFKESNALSYIKADADATLQRKSATEEEAYRLESQISLSKMLKETVIDQPEYSLLPGDIGLENDGLNALVADYNLLALERQKLAPNVGLNHPSLQALSEQLRRGKVNIIKSVNIYQAQLRISMRQLNRERSKAGALYSDLPEKEKTLRAIERQQNIKEELFLLLLQKREEAAIGAEISSPSIKVVDYGLTNKNSTTPRKAMVYPISFMLGMLVPFLILFIRFSVDTKIHDRSDIVKMSPEISLIGQIPTFKKKTQHFQDPHDRSSLAEAFRILGTNINYHLPKNKGDKTGRVIFVTSSIKGEGKSMVAYNLSMSYASLKKKVLLVGADLRNPQIKQFVSSKKKLKSKGLADYLSEVMINWEDCVQLGNPMMHHHMICLTGNIPPNPSELLAGEGFESFISEAKKVFDYIIVDTAPTLLVTDTLLISPSADMSLFVVRAGFTEKRLLEFANELNNSGKLKNMAFVLNESNHYGGKKYNYGYMQGYGQNRST